MKLYDEFTAKNPDFETAVNALGDEDPKTALEMKVLLLYLYNSMEQPFTVSTAQALMLASTVMAISERLKRVLGITPDMMEELIQKAEAGRPPLFGDA